MSRALALLWLLCVVIVATGLGLRLAQGVRFETSVLAMLPRDERDPILHDLASQLQGRAARTLLVLVGHPDAERAGEIARDVEAQLRASPAFDGVLGAVDAEGERAFHELYFPRRYDMLAPNVRASLQRGATPAELTERVFDRLSSPMSSAYSRLLVDDPLLLFPELLSSWSELGSISVGAAGFPTVRDDQCTYAVLTAMTKSDPFDASGLNDALTTIDALRARIVEHDPRTKLLFTGVPRFAADARERMQGEMTAIGAASTVLTALCILLVLGSWRPLALSFLPVVVSALVGAWFCIEVFPDVHMLTLVFGTSLTGMGVDYALHYFCVHRRAGATWNAQAGLRAIFPGITVGMLTSLLGFSGLYFTPFPVLQQFAAFSSVGLFAAWATVVAWYPMLTRAPYAGPTRSWFDAPNRWLLVGWAALNRRRATLVVLVVACAVSLFAASRLPFTDDVRKFQALAPHLVAEDAAVRALAGRTDEGRFVLVAGANEQEVLERLEGTVERLKVAAAEGALGGTHSLAPFLPSFARQSADRALLRASLSSRFDELALAMDDLGFEERVVANLRVALESDPPPLLDVETLFASSATQFLRPLWLEHFGSGLGAMVLLRDVSDPERVEQAVRELDGVHYVDRVRDLSRLMARYRVDAMRLVAIAYGVVLFALWLRFGIAHGTRVFLPAALASALTLLVLAACGVELTLFHLLGLLLVLGLAVDYGTFLAESDVAGATTMLALSLSTLTAMFAFGLMMFSSAPPLVAIGASVSLGITLSLFLAPSAWKADEAAP